MSVKPLLNLIKSNQLLALTGSVSLLKPFYQLNFLVALIAVLTDVHSTYSLKSYRKKLRLDN